MTNHRGAHHEPPPRKRLKRCNRLIPARVAAVKPEPTTSTVDAGVAPCYGAGMKTIPTRIPQNLCDDADRLCMPGQSRAGLIAQALRIGLDVLAREERETAARVSEAVTGWPAVRT